jgi:hypothetical protein
MGSKETSFVGVKSTSVKNVNGILMIAIHFGALYYVFESVSARLEPKDQIAVVMILAPLTATFVSLFLKDLVKNAAVIGTRESTFNVSFSGVTVLITILYGLTIFFILSNYLTNLDVGPDMLKLYIGVIETVIGGFVGIVYAELYK